MSAAAATAHLREHPMAGLVPDMRPEEWRAFIADIRERGILEPLHLAPDGRTVLDGRHRLRCARELGLPDVPTTLAVLGPGITEIDYMVRAALTRRHLSDDQRAVLAAKLAPAVSDERRHQAAAKAAQARWQPCAEANIAPTHTPRTREAQASAFTVTPHKVRQAVSVVAAAPDLADRVLAGDLPLRKASMQVKRRQAQEALAGDVPGGEGDARLDVWHGDFREVGARIADASIDMVLTDPPYLRECLPLWAPLGSLAARVLRPGGFLVAYSGQENLPAILAALSGHLEYYWLCGLQLLGVQTPIWRKCIHNAMKPILAFVKPPRPVREEWLPDLLQSPAPQKALHAWQQSIEPARALVRAFCPAGGLVLDLMAGAGTFPLAALFEGRRALALDSDPACCDVIRRRCSGAREGEVRR